MKIFKFLPLLICFSLTANADTIENIIDNQINKGLNSLGEVVTNLIPGEGDTEITFSNQENYDLLYSILAVRPIALNPYPGLDNEHLYFTQLRLANHEPYANGDQRILINAGLGFRTLVNNNNAILGINLFYDHELEQEHQRASIGIEYLASNFQLYYNKYDRISEKKSYVWTSSTITEEVLDGYDFSLVGQLPYLPWASVVYKGYSWNKTGTHLDGDNFALEANIVSGLMLEYGRNEPDNQGDEDFYRITFSWPRNNLLTPTLVSDPISKHAFRLKNMQNEMLHKIRRTNNIITQKTVGGVVIARGT
tara:strand:+ start:2415 stop:3338 length:924 start_codon:yes stop_codon:yes gene_type:complete